jgi:steroid delta-isomerase-like uncharacterized protein
VVERYFHGEGWAELELLSPDLVLHTHVSREPFVGHDGFREFMGGVRGAFSDATFTIERLVADEHAAVVQWTMRATHDGGFLDLPATGRRVELGALEYLRFEDGLVREVWLELDAADVLRQIGVMPAGNAPPPAPLIWFVRLRTALARRRRA